MTDRHAGYIIILEKNLREDDAENTLNAIRQIKNVLDVKPMVSDMSELIAQTRARSELGIEILELLRKK